jgi:hypothetical protein
MSRLTKVLGTFAASAAVVAAIGPANALTVTSQIKNAPQSLPLNNVPPGTVLQFGALNSNLPGIAPLGPNQKYVLNTAFISTKGKVQGTFKLNNSTFAPVAVASPALTFELNANMLKSADLMTTNTTASVPAAQATAASFTPGPPSPPPSSACDGTWTWGGTFWLCFTPGMVTETINPSGATSTAKWEVAAGGGAIYPNTNMTFWGGNGGNDVNVPSFLTFNFIPSAFPGASLASATGQFDISNLPADTIIEYDYMIMDIPNVPAPLPLLGASLGFGFSRRLRRRIKSRSINAA